jgi:hypothetical protein
MLGVRWLTMDAGAKLWSGSIPFLSFSLLFTCLTSVLLLSLVTALNSLFFLVIAFLSLVSTTAIIIAGGSSTRDFIIFHRKGG